MYKVAVIGDRDSVYGFAAAGMEAIAVQDVKSAAKILHHCAENQYAVLYITEALYECLGDITGKYNDDPSLAIVPIPGVAGNTGIGRSRVKKFVERAVGADILFKDRK